MSFLKLSEILRKIRAGNPSLSKRVEESQALSRWETAVGPQIAKHSRALRVQDRVLWIEVDHPIWKSELHYRKRQIIELLNQARPSSAETLEDLLFVDARKDSRKLMPLK